MNKARQRFPFLKPVADISNEDGSWNSVLISQVFGESLVGKIIGIARLPKTEANLLVWKGATDGMFSVKRGYEATHLPWSTADSNLWKKIWNHGIQFRLSFIIWRAMMGCLPTRDRLGFVVEKMCPFFADTVKGRIEWMLSILSSDLTSNLLKFTGCLIDEVWKARNEVLYKSKLINITEVRSSILRKFSEAMVAVEADGPASKTQDTGGAGGKINAATEVLCVSNASWKNGEAGLAVGLLHIRENRVFWFARKDKAESAAEAEMMAILWGLQLAAVKGFRSIVIASDAMVLIRALHEKRYPPLWKLRHMAVEVFSVSNTFVNCSFCFLNRKDNMECDALAKRARNWNYVDEYFDREGSPFVIPTYLL
ncbi:hypothetical protein F8388_004647 [Cannabis sativa]|uniref:RNase H type-1 domain-containing protein n=1 Tax=Cannabis sativa TaxID=3483 RepID=A0A7J6DTM7_CANSA|nr:hypothetical protein F8388_004647 [Cannabis sativa]KAF4402222.1 hypothetical protein G4B88_017734 [Cannabis sativa]